MSPETMPNYDIWKCHDPREDEPELSEEQVDWMNDYIVDLQNEAVADHGWDLLDPDQMGEAVAYLKAHQGEYQERAAECKFAFTVTCFLTFETPQFSSIETAFRSAA